MTFTDPHPFDPQHPERWVRPDPDGPTRWLEDVDGFCQWVRAQDPGYTPRGCHVLGTGWAWVGAFYSWQREQDR